MGIYITDKQIRRLRDLLNYCEGNCECCFTCDREYECFTTTRTLNPKRMIEFIESAPPVFKRTIK